MLEEQISFINEHDTRDEIFESTDIPTRNSLDQGKNSSGKRLIEIMSDANLLCLNGRKLGDTIGRLTCHEYNGSSTVDLALCSWDIYNQIQYFKVLDPVWYSDHCPIQLTIQTEKFFEEQPIDMDQFENLSDYYIWTPDGTKRFKEELESVEIQKRFRDKVLFFCDGKQSNTADTSTENFEDILKDIAKKTLIQKKSKERF